MHIVYGDVVLTAEPWVAIALCVAFVLRAWIKRGEK